MAEELEKWRYPRFFSDTIDENDRIIYMNDEDSKHIAQVLRMRKGNNLRQKRTRLPLRAFFLRKQKRNRVWYT